MTRFWWILIFAAGLFSCENEIQLFPENPPSVYMIYGLLDSNDSVQQIKVRKTLAGNASQNELASSSDLFIPSENIRVRVRSVAEPEKEDYEFIRNEYPKDPGFFANDRNPIYEAHFTPVKDAYYELILYDPELPEPITASLKAIGPPIITYPFNGDAYFRFTDTINPFYFQFRATGQVHLQQFYVNFLEIHKNGDTAWIHHRFDLAPRYKDSVQVIPYYGKQMPLNYLFNIIRLGVKEDEDVVSRVFHSFDYVVWAGDQVMKNYLQLAEIFPDNRKLFFSNINGGFGFFAASSHTSVEDIYPTQPFLDTLISCPITIGFKFQKYKYLGDFKRERRP